MEVATVPQQQETEAPEAQAEQTPAKLFQWSEWVHVGPGAEDCSNKFTGKCEDEDHFHAWCRLPNQFQIRDISDKAAAAKARRLRSLKDTASDACAIFEGELDELRETDSREGAVTEVLRRDMQDFVKADAEVREREEFGHFDQDREEWLRQLSLDEDKRSEEFARLQEAVEVFDKAIEEKVAEIRKPKREMLEALDWDELIQRVRKARVEQLGESTYFDTYNYWSWYVGTLKPCGVKQDGTPIRPIERYFRSIEELKSASSVVIGALDATFVVLRGRLSSGDAVKNS